jgi:hypothetical protein
MDLRRAPTLRSAGELSDQLSDRGAAMSFHIRLKGIKLPIKRPPTKPPPPTKDEKT